MAGVGVGPVFAIGHVARLKIGEDLVPRAVEQGADDADTVALANRRDGAQSARRGAAQETQEHGLGLVVGVVAGRERLASPRGSRFQQESVAGAAGHFLERIRRLPGFPGHVAPGVVTGNAVPGRRLAHESRILRAFARAGAVIEMGDLEGDAQIMKRLGEAHGIGAARHRGQTALACFQHVMAVKRIANAIQQFCGLLFHGPSPGGKNRMVAAHGFEPRTLGL